VSVSDDSTDGPGDGRRVALVHSAAGYVGPALARRLAASGHDLVLADPVDGLVDELQDLDAAVEVVDDASNPARPGATDALVEAAFRRFGRLDAAVAASGRIVVGRFVEDATFEDFEQVVEGCMEAPFRFLKSVVPAMADHGGGQVLVITSATAARATKGAPLYSMARAGATHLVRNVAAEVAGRNVQVNAVGTNFMDFPEFRAATGADDPEVRARIEAAVPMRRLGTMEEFAATCAVFLDGTSRFTTGQYLSHAGGW
jgi:3-oxoacyl-[acyl-carrier protein] reductase